MSMPDPRFFEDLGPVGLAELAELTGAQLANADAGARPVRAVAILAQAGPDTVTFLADRKHAEPLRDARARSCFVHPRDAELVPEGCEPLLTAIPQGAYAVAAERLHRVRRTPPGPAVAEDVELEEGVELAPGVSLGPGVRV